VPVATALTIWPRSPRPARAELLRACRGPFTACVVFSATVLAATGMYSAGQQIGTPDELLTTAYGRILLAKAGLLAVLVGCGLLHAARLYGWRLGDLVRRDARRLVLAEATVGAALLVAAGVLAGTPPARDRSPGPVAAPVTSAATAADLVISLSVTPNRPGQNVLSARVASSRRPPPAPVDAVSARAGGAAIALGEVESGRYLGSGRLTAGSTEVTILVRRKGESLAVRVPWRVPAASGPAPRPGRRLAPYANTVAICLLLLALALRARWLTRRVPDQPPAAPRRPAVGRTGAR
jgi:copper transport protein